MPCRARRPRRLGPVVLTSALVTAVLALGGCTGDASGPDGREVAAPAASTQTASGEPRGATAYERRGAFAVGDTVRIGSRTVSLRVSGRVDSLAYTSAGAVVSVLEPGQADDGRLRHTYHLVRPSGAVLDLGLVLDGADTTTDSDAPYLAWISGRAGAWEVHVLHVTTGERSRLPVSGPNELGAGTPSVLLDGDIAYVLLDEPVAVDRRTGETSRARGLTRSARLVADGRVVYPARSGPGESSRARVLDAVTGEELVELEEQTDGQADLSPDGRLVRTAEVVPSNGPRHLATFTIHYLDTGEAVTVEEHNYRWFWTPDGSLFRVNRDHVDLCAAGTDDCREVPANLPDGSWTMPEDAHFS